MFFFTLLCKGRANGLRYWLVGGTLIPLTGRKNFGTLKMLKKPHRTHKSSARFVGWRFVVQDSLTVKDLLAKR